MDKKIDLEIDPEMYKLAEKIVEQTEERENEDVGVWASRLSKSIEGTENDNA